MSAQSGQDVVASTEFELTELNEALDAFFSLLLNEYSTLVDGEARPVPYSVAYTLVGKMGLDLGSLREKWKRWHDLTHRRATAD